MVSDYTIDIVTEIIDEFDSITELIQEIRLNKDGLDENELDNLFEDLFDNLDVYGMVGEKIDNMVIYNSDCIDIIKECNYYSGWTALVNEHLGGEIDNISQLAYAIILQVFDEDDGYNLIRNAIIEKIQE